MARKFTSLDELPLRYIFLILVLGAGVYFYIAVRGVASEAMNALNLFGWATFDKTSVRSNGELVGERIEIWPFWTEQGEGESIKADRAVIETPGMTWVLRAALPSFSLPGKMGKRLERVSNALSDEEEPEISLPPMDRVAIRLENIRLDDDAAIPYVDYEYFGNETGAFLEAAGCKDNRYWTRSEISALLGLDDVQTDLRIAARAVDPGTVEIRVELSARGSSTLEFSGQISVADSSDLLSMEPRELVRVAISVVDGGFLEARNKTCADMNGSDVDTFVHTHIATLRRMLLADGLVLSDALESGYRSFLKDGGEMRLEAQPSATLWSEGAAGFSQEQRIQMLNAKLIVNDGEEIPFTMGATTPLPLDENLAAAEQLGDLLAQELAGTPVDPALAGSSAPPPAQSMVVTTAPVATVSAISAEDATARLNTITPGKAGETDRIEFDDLRAVVGEHVTIYTTYNTRREGILQSAYGTVATIVVNDRGTERSIGMNKNQVKYAEVHWD